MGGPPKKKFSSAPPHVIFPGIALTPAWVFLVKVFISLYILNVLMDQVDTLHVGRYWSVVLCSTIMTHIDDLKVKVIDLKFYVYHMFVV